MKHTCSCGRSLYAVSEDYDFPVEHRCSHCGLDTRPAPVRDEWHKAWLRLGMDRVKVECKRRRRVDDAEDVLRKNATIAMQDDKYRTAEEQWAKWKQEAQ